MIPVIEVSHLPSSASFYAAVCQPLGIYFLSRTTVSSSLDFGLPASNLGPREVFFTLSQTPHPTRSLLEFRASNSHAVTEFHRRALLALPNEFLSASLKHTAEDS